MTDVEFPPDEKVAWFGSFTRGEVIGATAAIVVGAGSLWVGRLAVGIVLVLLILVWTFLPRPTPLRLMVPAWVRWLVRGRKHWAAPLRGSKGMPPQLRKVQIKLAPERIELASGVVPGVVVQRNDVTVLFRADRESLVFAAAEERSSAFASWADILSGTCVERGSELAPTMIGWTDVHRAAESEALVEHHSMFGVQGPATEDYDEFVSGFGGVAAEHQVIVWVTLRKSAAWRAVRAAGFEGCAEEQMMSAAVSIGDAIRGEMGRCGITVSALLAPVEIGRVISELCDPFAPAEPLTAKERFGLADNVGPAQVAVGRHQVEMDHSVHRAFVVSWPKNTVDAGWMWRPLSIDGPKFTSCVFEPLPPSSADRQRDALATRGVANAEMNATTKRGHVSEKDRRKVQALRRAEVAVASGHQELDGYGLVVLSARSVAELNQRTQDLRQAMRQCGRASVRELVGQHDEGLAAALPIGTEVQAAAE